jgi:RNA polymerase sigma-70 factor (ECF subfamily)
MPRNDLQLVRRTLSGERAAFDTLYDRHAGRVYHLLRRLTGCDAEAEDLAQDAFVAAYGSLASWQGRGQFGTWLCGIAVRLYAGSRRRSERRGTESLDEELELPSREPGPPAQWERRELAERLEAAISALPALQREVFVLVKVEGLAYREAAEWLGVPLGTVQSRLWKAICLLQADLADLADERRSCARILLASAPARPGGPPGTPAPEGRIEP